MLGWQQFFVLLSASEKCENINIYRPGDFAQNQYVDDNSNKEYAIHWLHDETANFAFSDGRVENIKFVARKIFSANWQLL